MSEAARLKVAEVDAQRRAREENVKNKKIKISNNSILSAHDIDTNLLLDFYNIMYPERKDSLPHIWKWLNRSSFYENKTPLVMVYNDRVIAHMSVIPFYVLLDGKYYTATSGIDFAVLPEFQRRGLGTLLAKRRMELSDLGVGFPNERSIGLYKKLGWIEYFDSYLHYYLLRPFNHPKFIGSIPLFLRRILNIGSRPFLHIIYHKYASSMDNLRLNDLNSDSLDKFSSSLNMQHGTVIPVRDSDYISWRLLNSPDKDKYRVFSSNDIGIIIKICDNSFYKYIDLLLVSDSSKYSMIRKMISTLALWGMSKDYSYMRYYTSSEELSSYLSESLKSIVRYQKVIFYAKDVTLLEKLKQSTWHLELIDSDFEEF